jgi:acylphosphatase
MSGFTVSLDGLRRNLSGDVNDLRDIVEAVIAGEYYDKDDLIDAMNNVIQDSNVLNCVYDNDREDFNDMSDVRVEPLEQPND